MTYKQRKRFLLSSIAAIFFTLVFLPGCEYETIEIDEPDPDVPVSFSNEIVPIFNNNNNCTACHGVGATPPDLTPANAYNSIVPALVDLDDPEASRIYAFPAPTSATHGFKKYTQTQAALVLTWIRQGAENN